MRTPIVRVQALSIACFTTCAPVDAASAQGGTWSSAFSTHAKHSLQPGPAPQEEKVRERTAESRNKSWK